MDCVSRAICGRMWVHKLPCKVRKTVTVLPFLVNFFDCDLCHGMTLSRSQVFLAHQFLVYKSSLIPMSYKRNLLPHHGPQNCQLCSPIRLGKHPSHHRACKRKVQGARWHSGFLPSPPCSIRGWTSPPSICRRARQAQEHREASTLPDQHRASPLLC